MGVHTRVLDLVVLNLQANSSVGYTLSTKSYQIIKDLANMNN